MVLCMIVLHSQDRETEGTRQTAANWCIRSRQATQGKSEHLGEKPDSSTLGLQDHVTTADLWAQSMAHGCSVPPIPSEHPSDQSTYMDHCEFRMVEQMTCL